MSEIVTARDIYEDYGQGDDEGFESVRYVRESDHLEDCENLRVDYAKLDQDYDALLERHKSLIGIINQSVLLLLFDPNSYDLIFVANRIKAALAEEVDDAS